MTDDRHFDQRGQRVIGPQTNVAGDLIALAPPPVFIPHIPPPPKDFTGRDEELQDLLASFDRGATITGLRGMGGIGKTALAYALAEKLVDRYPDGQILVELRGTDPQPMTPGEAMAKVIRAYHPEAKLPESESDLADIYRSVLYDMHVLLLLDNAADDKQVRPLLPPPTCGVIVTSRHKFTLPGLMAKDLNVLKTDKAVELLLKCWKPDASPTREQLEDNNLLEIAQLCGFLPLALRAAGSMLANSPDLSPEEYRRDLKDERKRLEKIGKEGVDLDVGSSFSLSYNRLAPETAAVFRTLSIFPGDFDAKAEEFVCQDEDHKRLRELVRWSLVDFQRQSTGDQGRHHLHDLVRLFAAARLEAATKAEAQRRHAEHYQKLLSSATELYQKGGQTEALGKFDQERMNIEAGWNWGKQNYKVDNVAASLCSAYLNWPFLLELRFHPMERISWTNTALDAARQIKDRRMESVHLGNLGTAYVALGNARKAIEFYEQALVIAHEIGDRRVEGGVLGSLGNAYSALGDTRKAIEFYKQVLVIAREIGDKRAEGNVLGSLGLAYANLGDSRKAIEFYKQALVIARKIGDRCVEGTVQSNLGLAYYALGDTRKAIEFYEQALVIDREIGNKSSEGYVLHNLGQAYYALGDTRKAIKFHEEALTILRDLGDKRAEGFILGSLGIAYYALGDARKAIEFYEQALAIAREIGDRRGEGNALGNLGLAYADLGDTRKAIEFYEQRLVIAREIGDRRGEGISLYNMSLSQDKLGKRKEAIANAKSALKIYQQIESPNAKIVQQTLDQWKK